MGIRHGRGTGHFYSCAAVRTYHFLHPAFRTDDRGCLRRCDAGLSPPRRRRRSLDAPRRCARSAASPLTQASRTTAVPVRRTLRLLRQPVYAFFAGIPGSRLRSLARAHQPVLRRFYAGTEVPPYPPRGTLPSPCTCLFARVRPAPRTTPVAPQGMAGAGLTAVPVIPCAAPEGTDARSTGWGLARVPRLRLQRRNAVAGAAAHPAAHPAHRDTCMVHPASRVHGTVA